MIATSLVFVRRHRHWVTLFLVAWRRACASTAPGLHIAATKVRGDGGLGKSLLAQQLQASTAPGTIWLGLPVEQIVSLGLYCEDGEDELWRRQCEINADYGIDHSALAAAHWMPRLGRRQYLPPGLTESYLAPASLSVLNRQRPG